MGKNRTLKQNKVREATNMPSAPPLNIRNCINEQIMYIKSDTRQGIEKTINFPKRRGGGAANDLKWGS